MVVLKADTFWLELFIMSFFLSIMKVLRPDQLAFFKQGYFSRYLLALFGFTFKCHFNIVVGNTW